MMYTCEYVDVEVEDSCYSIILESIGYVLCSLITD